MKYKFKTPPRAHQVKALKKLLPHGGGGLFMPMRSGKTKTAIDFAGILHSTGKVDRVLVVCTLSTIGVWQNEIRKHLPDSCSALEWKIINYERLFDRLYNDPDEPNSWVPTKSSKLYKYSPQLIIVDEGHKLGDPSTVQSQSLYRLAKHLDVEHRLLLTGTPLHRKPFYIFGQFKFLDEGIFGTAFGQFKRRYGVWGGYGNYTLLKYINLGEMRRKIMPYVYYLKHIPEREPVHTIIPITLSPHARKKYKELSVESILELSGNRTVTADMVLTRLLRLSQIASGVIKDDEGALVRVSHDKRDAFRDWLDEARESEMHKIVVACRFLHEIKECAEVCKELGYRVLLLHGGVKSARTREQRIQSFHVTDKPTVFISQVSAGSLGIDLSVADTMLFYGPTPSLIDFDQMCARIRLWKDKRPLTYYHLLAEDTIDMLTFASLKAKRNIAEVILDKPKLLKG